MIKIVGSHATCNELVCQELLIRDTLHYDLPTTAVVNQTEYYLCELQSHLSVPDSFPSFNYLLLVDHIDKNGVTTCNPSMILSMPAV